MIRFVPIFIVAFCASIVGVAAAVTAPNFNGVWVRQDGNVRMEIAPCDGKLCAKNVWVKDPGGEEAVGDTLVMTLKPNASGGLSGEAFDRKRNQTYSIEIESKDAGITTQGCVLGGILCKDTNWSHFQ